MAVLGDELFWPKLGWTVLLLVATAFFCSLPFVLLHRSGGVSSKWTKLLMSYLNALAGGVVLGALLMHMIPELMHGHHGSAELASHGGHGHGDGHGDHGHGHGNHAHGHGDHPQGCEYPWGPLAAGISFLFLFSIDRIFMGHSHSPAAGGAARETAANEPPGETAVCDHERDECILKGVPLGSSSELLDNLPETGEPEGCSGQGCDHCTIDMSQSTCTQCLHSEHKHGGGSHSAGHASCHSHNVVGGCHMGGFSKTATQRQTYVFVVALSLHSLLEGLGFASKSSHGVLASFLGSLFAHKWLEALALGVAVLRAEYSPGRTVGLLTLYCLLTPVGMLGSIVVRGLFVSVPMMRGAKQTVMTWMDGFAAGSFLFVSLIEMIPPEFHQRDKHTPFKFALLGVGFALMAVVQIFHSH